MTFTVAIPTRNERSLLTRTVASLVLAEPWIKDIVNIDDASEVPEPSLEMFGGRTVRMPSRVGAGRARHIGAMESGEGGMVTIDGHQLFGADECEGAFRFELSELKKRGMLPADYEPKKWEVEMLRAPEKVTKVMRVAQEGKCIAYSGCCRHSFSTMKWENGFLRCKWSTKPALPVVQSAGMQGGLYAFSREALDLMGGYPQQPGYFGFEEETIALLSIALGLKIMCVTDRGPWHLFRGQGITQVPPPYTCSQENSNINFAAIYRLISDDKTWPEWKEKLNTLVLGVDAYKRDCSLSNHVMKRLETPSFTAYRDALQKNFVRGEKEIFVEAERLMAQDQAYLPFVGD